jgi:hypothetical protein
MEWEVVDKAIMVSSVTVGGFEISRPGFYLPGIIHNPFFIQKNVVIVSVATDWLAGLN